MEKEIPKYIKYRDFETVNTKDYGELTEREIFQGYFFPMFVNLKLKGAAKIRSKNIFKINIELDETTLKDLPKNKQKFYRDCIELKCFNNLTKKESEIYYDTTQDLSYSLR